MAVNLKNGDGRLRAAFSATLLAIVAIAGWLAWSTLTDGHNWGDDFATFLLQARDMAAGHIGPAMAMLNYGIEHSTRLLGPTSWGTSLLLAPLYKVFGLNFLALKSLNFTVFLLFLLLVGAGTSSGLPRAVRIAAAGLFAFNPAMIKLMDNIGNDLPFLFISTLGMVLLDRIVIRKKTLVFPSVDRIAFGLVIALAYFIRPNGVLILVTLMVIQAWRWRLSGKITAAIDLLPYASFAVAVGVWTLIFPDQNAKFGLGLEISPATIAGNVRYYAVLIADFFEGIPHPKIVYLLTLPLFVTGMVRLRRTAYPGLIYMALTVLLFVIVPFQQGLRYLIAILPFYALFVADGLEWPASRFTASRRIAARVISAAAILVVVAIMVRTTWRMTVINQRMHRSLFYGVATPSSTAMFRFIREQTKDSDVIVFFKPRAMMLMTGRRSIVVHEPAELGRGDYLCIYQGPSEERQIPTPAIIEGVREGSLVRVHSEIPLLLFKINRGP